MPHRSARAMWRSVAEHRIVAAIAYRARRAATTRYAYGPHRGEDISIAALSGTGITLGLLLQSFGASGKTALMFIGAGVMLFGVCMLGAPWRASDRHRAQQEATEAAWKAEQHERMRAVRTREALRAARERSAGRRMLMGSRGSRP